MKTCYNCNEDGHVGIKLSLKVIALIAAFGRLQKIALMRLLKVWRVDQKDATIAIKRVM